MKRFEQLPFNLLVIIGLTIAISVDENEENALDEAMHRDDFVITQRSASTGYRITSNIVNESDSAYWNENGQASLKQQIVKIQNTNVARNVILFVGDGMSIPTIMAARTYLGQLEGKTGEESKLSWENFPYTGFSKTYCVDSQVPDSACTATAYLCGIKNNKGTIGVNARVSRYDCEASLNDSLRVTSIAEWAQKSGKSAGIVTTTRVTHASPAALYAKVANRHWESDKNVISSGLDPSKCIDIATQLVTSTPGREFKVILGCGRREFLPRNTVDEEGSSGKRGDGMNLIDLWKKDKISRNFNYSYVWNRTALREVTSNPNSTDYILGLFESSHCKYHKEASPSTEPTLPEMTEAAINMLEKNKKGYFLFVEGGRIDTAHHSSYANLALDETVELAAAVKKASEMTSQDDTLIVVTSDHAHTMSVSGYASRGNDILGVASVGKDFRPYTTLSYANGPGYKRPGRDGKRYNIVDDNMSNVRYRYPATVPRSSETHGGEDVAIFARGPWSHLFTGTLEQHNIAHSMAYAACIGTGITACDSKD